MSYKYKLYKEDRNNGIRRYTYEELTGMGTFMLRDICVRERIMTHSAGNEAKSLKREALLELLYRYRGKNEETLAEGFPEDCVRLLRRMTDSAAIAAERIDIPYKLELKLGIPLSPAQEVPVHHGFTGDFFLGVLTDGQGEIKVVFEVQKDCLVIMPDRMAADMTAGVYRDFQFILFDAASSLKVLKAYNGEKYDMKDTSGGKGLIIATAVLPILTISEAEDSKDALVIDFGTSNTAAAAPVDGCFKNVCFRSGDFLCPTVAAAERCGEDKVSFLFGHEALKLIKRDGYGSSITFFHNLKQYLYEPKTLDICDCDENAASVSSDTVLRDFLLYIICVARADQGRNYKKLRFLMQEKRSAAALARIRELLPEYLIEGGESESVNSVYQEILEHIESGVENRAENGAVRELVFHCGGGDTTLVSCSYFIENTNVAYKVHMKERYLNGDGSFGGNNLTYLIFMYLKIKILFELSGRREAILSDCFMDAYTCVDEYGGTKEIYRDFYRLYEEAEAVIPTRFKDLLAEQRLKKENFYRLWFLAEQLKLAFFDGGTVSVIMLPDRFEEYSAVNVFLPEGISEYRLTFPVHRDELLLVMTPEIYRVVKTFIGPLCDEDGILMGYRIKFTGLSCNIPVFRDALKEFTVGGRVRAARRSPYGLKLRALEGAVLQEQMQRRGRVISELMREEDAAACMVTAKTHDGRRIRLISDDPVAGDVFGSVTRHNATREVEFSVCDLHENVVRKRIVFLNIHDFKEIGYDTLFERYPMLRDIQGDIDSIGPEEIRLFVFKQEGWDFSVLPVAREAGILKVSKISRFLFEDDSVDYFCGIY